MRCGIRDFFALTTLILLVRRLNYSGFVRHLNDPLAFTKHLIADGQMVLAPGTVFRGQLVINHLRNALA